MARPRTPFNESPAKPIYDEIVRFAAVHGWQVPCPYRFWKIFRGGGHPIKRQTFYYHWKRLVELGKLLTADGVYWLPPSVTLTSRPMTLSIPLPSTAPLPPLLPARIPRRPGRDHLQ